MASRLLSDLTPELKLKAKQVLEISETPILIYCTLRSMEEQAKLWRQSRSFATILRKKEHFENMGRADLAEILINVGPQNGKHVTYACCGESWHNYRKAFDGVPMKHGKALWSRKHVKEWGDFENVIKKVGLIWGGDWNHFRDYVHVQDVEGGNPLKQGF